MEKLERHREEDWRLLLLPLLEIFRFLALEFLSQNTNTRMLFRNVRMYTYMYTYTYIYIQNLDLDDGGGSRFARPIIKPKLIRSMLSAGIV